MKISVIAGNPKGKSRTLDAAILAAGKLGGQAPATIVDVIDLGSSLLEFGNPKVAASIESIRQSDTAIFASPTFKGSYSGILKLYLDQIGPDGLKGMLAFPLMLGASPYHAMAPDLLLKPVLVELGAICLAPGLYLLDKTYSEDPRLDAWVERTKSTIMKT